ncbi:MAG: MFS transporter, partial [Hyphomonadaceae bacterium]|nr:MFS transporter [Hyphomonadaceae bacterium]
GPPRPRGQLMQAIPTLVKNRAFILLFFGVAIFGGFYGAEISMTAYMAKYWLGDESYTKILFTAQAVASLASIPFWYWLGVKKGKTHVWIAGVIMAATGLLGLFFLRPDNLYTMAGLYAFTNMGATGFITVFYAMTADSVDWGEWKTGQRHEGIIFGLVSFANKFAAGVASFGVGAGLALIGFKADTQLDDGQLSGMFVIGMLLPALAFLAAAALMTQYPVSRQVHGKIVADLVRK